MDGKQDKRAWKWKVNEKKDKSEWKEKWIKINSYMSVFGLFLHLERRPIY